MNNYDPVDLTEIPAEEKSVLLAELATSLRSIPPFDLVKLLAAIKRMRSAERMNSGASAVARRFSEGLPRQVGNRPVGFMSSGHREFASGPRDLRKPRLSLWEHAPRD